VGCRCIGTSVPGSTAFRKGGTTHPGSGESCSSYGVSVRILPVQKLHQEAFYQ
jgi:hypothetical protein